MDDELTVSLTDVTCGELVMRRYTTGDPVCATTYLAQVPRETAERWEIAQRDFTAAQREMQRYYEEESRC